MDNFNPNPHLPMSFNSQAQRLPLFGITNPSLLARLQNPNEPFVPFGLYTLLYGSPAKPFATGCDDHGAVNRYKPLRPLCDEQYLPLPAGRVAPEFGGPHENAIVLDEMHPDEVVCGPWDQVASTIAENYAKVREGVLAHPLEGYFVAKFLSDDAVKYSGQGGSDFDVPSASAMIQQMAILRVVLYAKHPEWAATRGVIWEDFSKLANSHGLALSN